MNKKLAAAMAAWPCTELAVAEISGDNWGAVPWREHDVLEFPEFDLCNPPLDLPQFDVVFCEQVLEHVDDPRRALETLHGMVRSGGRLVVDTPFMVKIHEAPVDNWRFTESGLRRLLDAAGFEVEQTGSWGNRIALVVNTFFWPASRPWWPRWSSPTVPLVVWAIGRRR